MSKYEQAKYNEGRRVALRQMAGEIVSGACPYGVGDGNVSRAEWAWSIGYSDGITEAGR